MSIVEQALRKQTGGVKAFSVDGATAKPLESGAAWAAVKAVSDGPSWQGEKFFGTAGAIDFSPAKLVAAGLAPHPKSEARQVAQFRSIRKTIADGLRNSERTGEPMRRVMAVTSAFAGDGKTYSAFNLARSLSRDGEFQVLLIDGDLTKRRLSASLGLSAVRGLSEVLVSEDISMASVSFSDGGDSFFVMGAGQAHVVATERLASDALRRVLSELVAQYPKLVVIIDSGPILLTSESEAVITASDAVIFIVRAGVTPKSAVQDAVTRLGTTRPVSLILNAWQSAGFGDQESYYGEYYGDSAGPGR